MRERLDLIGVDVNNLPFEWEHFSLHDTGYSKYSDAFKGETYAGINFHPTYEAKMWRWLKAQDVLGNVLPKNDSVGFWMVGREPDGNVVKPFYTHPEAA